MTPSRPLLAALVLVALVAPLVAQQVTEGEVPTPGAAGVSEVLGRYQEAVRLDLAGEVSGALALYLDLWSDDRSNPLVTAWRRTSLLETLGLAARRHRAVAEAFEVELQDLDDQVHSGTRDPEDLLDWFHLAGALGRREWLIAWVRSSLDQGPVELPPEIERGLVDLLFANGLYRLAGRLETDPVGTARTLVADQRGRLSAHAEDDPRRRMLAAMVVQVLRPQLVRRHAAALAADRVPEARELARLALAEMDDARTRVELVDAAVNHARALPEHPAWLREAEAMHPDGILRSRIRVLRRLLAPPFVESEPMVVRFEGLPLVGGADGP